MDILVGLMPAVEDVSWERRPLEERLWRIGEGSLEQLQEGQCVGTSEERRDCSWQPVQRLREGGKGTPISFRC